MNKESVPKLAQHQWDQGAKYLNGTSFSVLPSWFIAVTMWYLRERNKCSKVHSRTLQQGRCESRLVGSCSKSNSGIRECTNTHGVNRIVCLADISENFYLDLNPTVARHLKGVSANSRVTTQMWSYFVHWCEESGYLGKIRTKQAHRGVVVAIISKLSPVQTKDFKQNTTIWEHCGDSGRQLWTSSSEHKWPDLED